MTNAPQNQQSKNQFGSQSNPQGSKAQNDQNPSRSQQGIKDEPTSSDTSRREGSMKNEGNFSSSGKKSA